MCVKFANRIDTNNDPVNMTDPSGKCPWCVVGAIIGAAVQTYTEVKNGSFDKGFGEGLKAVGRIAVSAGSGALGGGLGTAAAKLGNVVVRVAVNTAGSAAIGGASAAGQQAVSGQEVTSDAVIDGAKTGALFGAGGSVVGEAVEAVGRGVAAANYNSLSTSQKILADHVANATPGASVNTGQQAGTAAVTTAKALANTIGNSGGLAEGLSCNQEDGCK